MSFHLTPEQRDTIIDALAARMTEVVEVSGLEAFYYTAQYESLEELDDGELLERMDNFNIDLEDLK